MLCISDADLATFSEVEHFQICCSNFALQVTLKAASVKLFLNRRDFTFWRAGHQQQKLLVLKQKMISDAEFAIFLLRQYLRNLLLSQIFSSMMQNLFISTLQTKCQCVTFSIALQGSIGCILSNILLLLSDAPL